MKIQSQGRISSPLIVLMTCTPDQGLLSMMYQLHLYLLSTGLFLLLPFTHNYIKTNNEDEICPIDSKVVCCEKGERYWISKSVCTSWESSPQSISPGNGKCDIWVLGFFRFFQWPGCSIMARLEITFYSVFVSAYF